MRYFKPLISLGVIVALAVGIFLITTQSRRMPLIGNNQEVSSKSATTASAPVAIQMKRPRTVMDPGSVYEQIEKLPPEERELARSAKKSLRIDTDANGNYMLVEVDGKMVRKDPALKYLKDYKKSDPADPDVLPETDRMIRSNITTEAVGR